MFRLRSITLFMAGLAGAGLFVASLALPRAPVFAAELPEQATLRAWIEEMKAADRGPFARIRWFCKDGQILPPKAFACVPFGGGAQHGEWSERVKHLRDSGYAIANFFSDLDIEALLKRPDRRDVINQMLIEQFLITSDDGWILRRARFYRGAFQEEGERKGTRRLLFKLAEDPAWLTKDYLALRTATRLLRHGAETDAVAEVRQVSAAFAKKDPAFKRLRNKIHIRPEVSDAEAVRAYAAGVKNSDARAGYERLAKLIEEAYSSRSVVRQLRALAAKTKDLGDLGKLAGAGADRLERSQNPGESFTQTAELMAALRDRLTRPNGPKLRIQMLDAGLLLGATHFTAATELRDDLDGATRSQRLVWLKASAQAVYGAGLISNRQRKALATEFAKLSGDQVKLRTYKQSLDYLALVPGWGSQWLRYQFQDSMQKFAALDPLANLFIQDQLRSSPLFFYAQLLDSLLRDANRLAGIRNELLGEDVGSGLRSLNPGLAQGRLFLAGGEDQDFRADGIYLLPETISELPPVAGILTLGEGNPLSHVQLLARNLGIPNVAVDEALIPKLKRGEGKNVILAVSPAGSVRLAEDQGELTKLFGEQEQGPNILIRPDLEKLNLGVEDLIPLSKLRADDSGRTVGPKAAKLGELRYNFPEAVADGLTIPFGVFRRLLDQPYEDSGRSVFDWMVASYRSLERLPSGSAERDQATETFRAKLFAWIEGADPGQAFRSRLKSALAAVFGEDGSYGVFVRSDTNVEDLPGFTGAGLNLTVANVVGFENILKAIPRVWASPFTARAFSWRQSHMDKPEHVYPAILLLRSVPAEKSGVLVTQDIDTGDKGLISVAVNEGVGGAVDGQAAESLRINVSTGEVRLLAQATAAIRRRVNRTGGVDKIPVSGDEEVLKPGEIEALIALVKELPQRFPAVVDANGDPTPSDIEFGFEGGELRLFQIRPFLESAKARGNEYLKSLDSSIKDLDSISVNLNERPTEGAL